MIWGESNDTTCIRILSSTCAHSDPADSYLRIYPKGTQSVPFISIQIHSEGYSTQQSLECKKSESRPKVQLNAWWSKPRHIHRYKIIQPHKTPGTRLLHNTERRQISEKQHDCVWQKQTLVDKGLQGDRYSGVLAVIQAGGINCYLHFLLLFFFPSLFFQVFHNE